MTETDEQLIDALNDERYRYWQRLRVLGDVPEVVRLAAIEAHVPLIEAPVVSNGRIELRHYLLEQAISETTHRYGNLLTE